MNKDRRIGFLSVRLKCLVLAASVLLSAFAFAGCFELKKPTSVKHPSATDYDDDTPTPSPTSTPTPTPDPRMLIVKHAGEYGITEEELNGKYEFFEQYSETLEGNEVIDDIRPYFYHVFPLVAKYIKSGKEEHFLKTLMELKFRYNHTDGADGLYDQKSNTLELDPALKEKYGVDAYASVAYHEIIHFVDTHIEGNSTYKQICYMNDGSFALYSDVMNNQRRADVKRVVQSYFLEGGCEKYNSEFYTYAPLSYPARVAFITGMEYIYGSDKIKEMYFSGDTDYQFVKLLQENGFTNDEIFKLFRATNLGREQGLQAKSCLDPREALIRLYNNKMGTDYKEDAAFCRIIAAMDDKELNKIPSNYRKEISKYKAYTDKEIAEFWRFATNYIGGSASTMIGYYGKPVPMMFDGKLKIVLILAPVGQRISDYQVAVFDYDFDTKEFAAVTIFDDWLPIGAKTSESSDVTAETKETDVQETSPDSHDAPEVA